MTGPELAAVGKAVEVIGQKTLGQDEDTRDELLKAAQGTPEFNAAARTAAARIAVKERIKLKLYQPFARMIGVSRTYFEDVFPEEMAAKTAHIPDEHMITPPASVAVPAMQGLSYTFEEPDLRELYLNLLTTATDDRRTGDAHPAFAEVIKQLSAPEAKFLNTILQERAAPIVRLLEYPEGEAGYRVLMTHVADIRNSETGEPKENPHVPTWVDNWHRLGLVEATYAQRFRDDEAYEWVTARPEYLRLSQEPRSGRISYECGLAIRTAFGERFLRAVTPPQPPAAVVVSASP
ncbi:DUF4393 domain-containing protein [Micromonospora chersina]|uniref:DUF4393 domain-containing protein n=1 Tax=Micromonospora chersina TaxID=47854 RepID=UPI003713B603